MANIYAFPLFPTFLYNNYNSKLESSICHEIIND